jgi:hypothetical protein
MPELSKINQITNTQLEGYCNLMQLHDTDVLLTALNSRNIRPVEISPLGELLLRKTQSAPLLANRITEQLARISWHSPMFSCGECEVHSL